MGVGLPGSPRRCPAGLRRGLAETGGHHRRTGDPRERHADVVVPQRQRPLPGGADGLLREAGHRDTDRRGAAQRDRPHHRAPRTGRRRRGDRAVELSAGAGSLQDRPRTCRGLHGGAQGIARNRFGCHGFRRSGPRVRPSGGRAQRGSRRHGGRGPLGVAPGCGRTRSASPDRRRWGASSGRPAAGCCAR